MVISMTLLWASRYIVGLCAGGSDGDGDGDGGNGDGGGGGGGGEIVSLAVMWNESARQEERELVQ